MDSQLQQEPPRRELVPDVLKCLGCLCVIVIHTASEGMAVLDVGTANWLSAVFWGCVCRPAVPIFLMVSGALLYDPAREMSLRRIYTRYFLRILLILLVWSFAYELYFIAGYWILYRWFNPMSIPDAVRNVLTFRHHFHLYYLQILLIFYCFLPLMRTFTAHAGRDVQHYMLIVWFVLGIFLPTLFRFKPFSDTEGIPAQYPLNMTYSAMGYSLMGWYIKNTEITRADLRRWLPLFLAGFAVVFGVTVGVSVTRGQLYQNAIYGFTPGVALMAIGAYGSISALYADRDSGSMPHVTWISKASFCIFLSHHVYVMFFRTVLHAAYMSLPVVLIPLESAAVFALSVLTYVILRRIPWVKDHLI